MTRRLISSGSKFEAEIGFSRALVDGDWIFVSGTTGFNYETMTIAEGVVEQTEQCLRNISAALTKPARRWRTSSACGTSCLTREDFPLCYPALRRYFGDVRPAATMIEAGLIDRRVLIEIEVTARRRATV